VIKLLYKNTLVKIKKSIGRYISLLVIIMVGVGFFVGIQASAPDIIATADNYYDNHDLMNFKIISSMGLTDDDVDALKFLNNVTAVIPSYSLDVLDHGKAIKVHAIEKSVNTVKLIDGHMPQTDNECVADSKNYKVDDNITITGDASEKLNNLDLTVVGTVESVLYLADDYGNSTVGDGNLSSFIFVNRDNFILEAYTEIYITTAWTKNVIAYSKEYDEMSLQLNDELVKIKPERENLRYQEIYNKAINETKLSDVKIDASEIKQTKWYVFDRDAIVGYNSLKSGTNTITSVAKVFPFFFILIVMLMTSNTMARMIEEERSELGTLTSLGYKDKSIISTYLMYVLSASALGVIIGFFIGCRIIPQIIYACFKFILPPLNVRYDLITFLLIFAVALIIMTSVTFISCYKELKQKPATLLRPVPPKSGQKIMLEKIGFIWTKLSFTWKVTLRNMFRSKKRGIMTIIGIAGCTALLLAGFGLRDSMDGVVEKQYGEIFKYNDFLILKNETQTISGDLESLLKKENITDPVLIKQSAFTCELTDRSMDAYMIMPENEEDFYKQYHLKSILTGSDTTFDENGVVITQKLSEVLKIGKGDSVNVKDTDNNIYHLTVSDVAENYTMNYFYMNKDLYSKVFGKSASYNAIVSNFNGDKKVLAEHLIDSDLVINVIFTSDVLQKAIEGNGSLNNIIILIVCIAALLEIIVLYNLTSINLSERRREIATLKVLGFTDGETNGYIYREAFILTLFSIGVGLIFGIVFHHFIVGIIEDDTSILFKKIHALSFLWAFLITLIFSIIMQFVTYFKLKEIDMIESLKSVE